MTRKLSIALNFIKNSYPQERSAIRILLFFLILAFSQVSSAFANKKSDFLLHFFDMNEAAFAYHRHCLSTSHEINKKFLQTMELIADALFENLITENPQVDAEQIKAKILERRYNLQYRLDSANIEQGCTSQDTQIAKKHYEEFSHFDKLQIKNFIDEQEQKNR